MSMSYSHKAKCQGCAALSKNDKGFCCLLNLPVKFDGKGEEAMHPAPDNVKCYKPKNVRDLKIAENLHKQKSAQKSLDFA